MTTDYLLKTEHGYIAGFSRKPKPTKKKPGACSIELFYGHAPGGDSDLLPASAIVTDNEKVAEAIAFTIMLMTRMVVDIVEVEK